MHFFFRLCGFDNALSFKNIRDEDIDVVEKYISEKYERIPDFKITAFDKFQSENLGTFKFYRGHRLLIKELAYHVKTSIEKLGISDGVTKFSLAQHKCEMSQPALQDIENGNCETLSHFFLKKLLSAADKNSNRMKGGYRYDPEVKMFASYLRMIVGPLAYETIHRNLEAAIPSLPSVNRYIRASKCHINEGILRSNELLIYLKERNLSLDVALSEDGTRVVDKPQYCSGTNQIVGFVPPINKNGMPVPFHYPARNANEILLHFSNDYEVSSYINVIMAQPIADVPPFCLLIYGTDNKYTSNDVSNRWKYVTSKLAELGIRVLSIASDSDPRNNAAMRDLSNIGMRSKYEWFSCDTSFDGPFLVQDPIHIATKMRNFLLRFSWNKRVLPFGKYFIRLEHLHFLVDKISKDQHELTKSTLNPADRQNFESVKKMFDGRVLSLLRNEVPESNGTVQYLQILRDIVDAYMDKNITPLQRIRKIWYSLFLIRIWRNYVVSKKEYTLKENFLTGNCYSCIEINAHSLILCIMYLERNKKPELFLPHLFDSQTCESTFRQFRSMTSAFSTITNCTVKEAISRVSKIQLQNEIMHKTSSVFVYPRMKKPTNAESKCIHPLPSPQEIYNEIVFCKKTAIVTATNLGLITKGNSRHKKLECKVNPHKPKVNNIAKQLKSLSIREKPSLKMPSIQNIQLKDYTGKLNRTHIDERSSYAEIRSATGKKMLVRKTSLCWLLRKETRKVSNDRLLRVRNHSNKQSSISRKQNKTTMSMYTSKTVIKRKKKKIHK